MMETGTELEKFLKKISWTGHAGFLIRHNSLNIYIDPCLIQEGMHPPADIVLITHDHPRHCSVSDVRKIAHVRTIVAGPADCICRFRLNQLHLAPGQEKNILGIPVRGISAYNSGGGRHPKEKNWIGFLLELDGLKIYHAGDTDFVPELSGLKADVAILSAFNGVLRVAESAKKMGAKLAIPMQFRQESEKEDYRRESSLYYLDI